MGIKNNSEKYKREIMMEEKQLNKKKIKEKSEEEKRNKKTDKGYLPQQR